MTLGILCFTNQKVLDHKLKDGKRSENNYCFWEMGRFPKKFMDLEEEDLRLYLAVNGQVKGYFKINNADWDSYDGSGELEFYSEDWVPIKNGEILKPSQGFRYYLHD